MNSDQQINQLNEYKAALELFSDYFYFADIDSHGMYVNVRIIGPFEKITGYKFDELVQNEGYYSIIEPNDLGKISDTVSKNLPLLREYQLEYRIKHKDGQFRWIKEFVKPLAKNSNNSVSIIGSVQDVTIHKNREFELIEKDNHIKNISNNFPAVVSYVDNTLTYQFVNNAYESWFQLTSAEIIGKKASDILDKAAYKNAYPYMQRALNGEIVLFENCVLNYSGAERILKFTYVPKYNLTNEISGFYVFGIDITELKKLEKSVLESEARYKIFFENNHSPILIINPENGNIIDTNEAACKFYGYSGDTFRTLQIDQIANGFKLENYQNNQNDFQAKTTPQELQHKKSNGEIREVEVYDGSIEIEGKSFVYLIIHDITQRKNSENELRIAKAKAEESESRYKVLLKASFGGIAILDKGRILDCNQGLSEISGFSTNELIKMDVLMLIAEQSRNLVLNNILAGYEKAYEAIGLRKNAQEYPLRLKARKNRLYEQNVIAIEFRDITEEKLAEKAIQENEEKYRLIAENSSDVVWVMDLNLNFSYLSPSSQKLFGYSIEERKSMSIERMYKTDTISKLKTFVKLKIQEYYQNHKNNANIFELEGIHKCGHTIYFEVSAKFIIDNHGKIVGIQGTSRDITERKKDEQTIRKLQKAVESSKACIIITDANGNIEYANPFFTESTGYSPEDYLGKNPRILKTDLHEPAYYQNLWSTIKSGQTWEGEFCNRKKDKTTYWEKVIISPITNHTNEITHFVAVKRDITEAKKNNEELIHAKEKAEESDRLKSQFLQNMSHEIRTPLNGIIGFTDLLVKTQKQEKEVIFKEHIQRCSNQLLVIIENIIEFSQIQSTEIKVIVCNCDLGQILNQVIREFKQKYEKNDIQLTFINHLKNDENNVSTDKYKFLKILNCLLDNSFKFTCRGKIEVGCEISQNNPDFLQLYVSDTGIGITPEQQELIFMPFRQVESGLSRQFGGNGLGLSIAKAYIEKMGGTIWLTSAPNLGTSFYFTLPYTRAQNKPDNEKITNEKTIEFSNLTILIAEDEQSNYLYLIELLEEVNIKVLHAPNGQIAVDLCRNDAKIDLILMDIKMPVMDGITATKIIKAFRPQIRIIAQTAFSHESEKIKFLEYNFDDFIAKPIKQEDLYFVINRNIRKT